MLSTAQTESLRKVVFISLMLLCLLPFVSSATALVVGALFALAFGNPFLAQTQKHTSTLLQVSVVGLGAGMNLEVVGLVGLNGIGYTAVGILLTLGLGLLLGLVLKVPRTTSLLVAVGTAICGGSAIAAVAGTIRAKSDEVSIALATVFFLNASALILFPWVGHALDLSQHAFGMWSALAIHDTSSVVGASLSYGDTAVQVATTVKLARALWIVPVTLMIGALWTHGRPHPAGKAKRPWFILGFLVAAALVTWIPALQETGELVNFVAKRTLVVTLFLIGASLSASTLRNVGARPFIQGLILWICVAAGTLAALEVGWI